MTTRGMRNNNPGNLDREATPWQGEVRPGTDPRFAQFSSMAYGIRALGTILRTYQEKHGLHTVEAMINRWAPPNENQTGAYVANVCLALGVHPTDPFPLSSMENMLHLIAAICHQENGGDLPSHDDMAAGMAMLFPRTPPQQGAANVH